jgi:CBS domain-containing protein
MERLRDLEPTRSLTAVHEEDLVDEALELLELSSIPRVPVGDVEPLAVRIRDELNA